MNKKQFIFFTEVVTILNEAGEEKVKRATTKKPSNDHDLDFYDRLGLKPPDDLLEDPEIDEDGFMNLSPDEFTYDFQNRFIDMTDFFTAVDADEFGSILQFYSGREYWVEEDLFEVYARIYVSQMNWFERFKESVSLFFARKN